MKKLMIAAAIVCAAAFAQAASVDWTSAAGIKGIADATFAAGLEDGTSYAADGKLVTTSGYQTYGSGTLAYTLAITYDLGDGAVTDNFSGTLAKGAGLNNTGKIASTITSTLFEAANAGTDYTYSLILTDTGTDGKDQKFTITATIEGASKVPTGDIAFQTAAPATWVASVESVPEPTSGLLLLLGVAGLALRRRRA